MRSKWLHHLVRNSPSLIHTLSLFHLHSHLNQSSNHGVPLPRPWPAPLPYLPSPSPRPEIPNRQARHPRAPPDQTHLRPLRRRRQQLGPLGPNLLQPLRHRIRLLVLHSQLPGLNRTCHCTPASPTRPAKPPAMSGSGTLTRPPPHRNRAHNGRPRLGTLAHRD